MDTAPELDAPTFAHARCDCCTQKLLVRKFRDGVAHTLYNFDCTPRKRATDNATAPVLNARQEPIHNTVKALNAPKSDELTITNFTRNTIGLQHQLDSWWFEIYVYNETDPFQNSDWKYRGI